MKKINTKENDFILACIFFYTRSLQLILSEYTMGPHHLALPSLNADMITTSQRHTLHKILLFERKHIR